jgi:hypothetical protein
VDDVTYKLHETLNHLKLMVVVGSSTSAIGQLRDEQVTSAPDERLLVKLVDECALVVLRGDGQGERWLLALAAAGAVAGADDGSLAVGVLVTGAVADKLW